MLSFNLFEIRFKSMIIERSYSYPLTAIIFLKRHKYECMNIHKKHVLEEMTYIKTIECRFNSFLYSLFLSLSLSLSREISIQLFSLQQNKQFYETNSFIKLKRNTSISHNFGKYFQSRILYHMWFLFGAISQVCKCMYSDFCI